MGADEAGGRVSRARPAVHDLTLAWPDCRERSIRASEDETVLDSAERAGACLPFGCLTGACASCAGRVLDGRVEHRRPPRALEPRHLDGGYALLCIAEPRADCRIEVGADVRTALVSTPWR